MTLTEKTSDVFQCIKIWTEEGTMKKSVFPSFQHRGLHQFMVGKALPSQRSLLAYLLQQTLELGWNTLLCPLGIHKLWIKLKRSMHQEEADCPRFISEFFKKKGEELLSKVGKCGFLKQWGI